MHSNIIDMKNVARLTSILFLIQASIFYSCSRDEIPTLTTSEITSITTTSAKTGGIISNDGGDKVTSCGVCWNTSGNPTIADSRTSDDTDKESFSSDLALLIPNTYYTVRAYATNSAGTGYGNELSFVTLEVMYGSLNDIDGNTYRTVTIGTQTWMAENLKTTRYNDDTAIPLVTDNTEWKSLIHPGYCWYNNDALTYKDTYGALYNWYAAASGKLCPTGWRVPSDAQWLTLSTYLGGESLAGDKMKEEGSAHWKILNNASTNVSGFTALPGGGRVSGSFSSIEESGAWWSSTEYNADFAWCRELDDNVVELMEGSLVKNMGFSVRCIKN
jgi:uncharacterized protein (TIGR02145 family)